MSYGRRQTGGDSHGEHQRSDRTGDRRAARARQGVRARTPRPRGERRSTPPPETPSRARTRASSRSRSTSPTRRRSEQLADLAGDVSIVINNAGVGGSGPLLQADLDDIRAVFETNLFGAIRVAQAFAPALARNGGGALVDIHSALSWIAGAAPTVRRRRRSGRSPTRSAWNWRRRAPWSSACTSATPTPT